jgi:hypothetical protein
MFFDRTLGGQWRSRRTHAFLIVAVVVLVAACGESTAAAPYKDRRCRSFAACSRAMQTEFGTRPMRFLPASQAQYHVTQGEAFGTRTNKIFNLSLWDTVRNGSVLVLAQRPPEPCKGTLVPVTLGSGPASACREVLTRPAAPDVVFLTVTQGRQAVTVQATEPIATAALASLILGSSD